LPGQWQSTLFIPQNIKLKKLKHPKSIKKTKNLQHPKQSACDKLHNQLATHNNPKPQKTARNFKR
jgi:hypothetical protein